MPGERKKEHVEIILGEDVKASTNYWDDVVLVHRALPEVDLDEIDTRTRLFGKELAAPLVISSMTGGFADAKTINRNLAAAAAEVGVAMGVGSQRPALQGGADPSSWSVVREYEVPLRFANIGAPQLVPQGAKPALGLDEARRAMDMVDAHLLIVHLNYAQEVVQPEGDRKARGVTQTIQALARQLPVVGKETGAGLSREVAQALKRAGVKGIDVGGLGGTSFPAVEFYRAKKEADRTKERLGRTFWDWGIPTPASVVFARDSGLPIIATGGVRHGLDVARACALGASAAGMASPMLKPATESKEAVVEELNLVIEELKAAMFLTGCDTVDDLRKASAFLQGATADWVGGA